MSFKDGITSYFPIVQYLSNEQLIILIKRHGRFSEVLLCLSAFIGLCIYTIVYVVDVLLVTIINLTSICLNSIIKSLMKPYSDMLVESLMQEF